MLLKTVLKPLVMYPSLSVRVAEQPGEGTIMALQCLEESHNEKSTPSQVYSKVLLVLRTLHSHLLGTVQSGPYSSERCHLMSLCSNCCYSPDVSIGDRKLSAILGELIWEEISRCIIHECLIYSIPTNSSQLEKYNTVWTQQQFCLV